MVAGPPYSKRHVTRAGRHLADRLRAVRAGERTAVIDEHDAADLEAREVVIWWRDQHVEPMLEVEDVVRGAAPGLRLRQDTSVLAVSARPKRFETMIDKLTRESGSLADMADLGGVRAVVDDQEAADALVAALSRTLDLRRPPLDRVRAPHATGYRAVHLHVRRGGLLVEVQVRTFSQDAWANLVEVESDLSGHNYKAGSGPEPVLRYLRILAGVMAALEGTATGFPVDSLTRAFEDAAPYVRHAALRLKTP